MKHPVHLKRNLHLMLFRCKPMSDDDTENSGTENNVSEAPASTPSEGIMGQIDNYFGISKAGSSVEVRFVQE